MDIYKILKTYPLGIRKKVFMSYENWNKNQSTLCISGPSNISHYQLFHNIPNISNQPKTSSQVQNSSQVLVSF